MQQDSVRIGVGLHLITFTFYWNRGKNFADSRAKAVTLHCKVICHNFLTEFLVLHKKKVPKVGGHRFCIEPHRSAFR